MNLPVPPPVNPEPQQATESTRASCNPGATSACARQDGGGRCPAPAPAPEPAPEPVIRVLVADDHDSVRSGLRQFINEDAGMQVVADVGTAMEVCKFLNASSCDVLILDLGLPDHNGAELLRVLKQTHPSLPVLVYTMQLEEEYAHYCLQAGAAGFLNKASNAGQIVAAIRQVLQAGGNAPRNAAGPTEGPERRQENLPLASPQ